MRGLSGAIVILMLAGGAIVYLAVEKFAPRRICACEQECQLVVSTPTPFEETDASLQPTGGSEPTHTTHKDELEKIAQEKVRLETLRKELKQEAQRLRDWERDLNRLEAEQHKSKQKLIDDQVALDDKTKKVETVENKLMAEALSLEEQQEQIHQAESNLERLQIGTFILADLILIAALVVFGLPLLKRHRTQPPHTASSL